MKKVGTRRLLGIVIMANDVCLNLVKLSYSYSAASIIYGEITE